MLRNLFIGAMSAAATLAVAGSASAATYVSLLEYKNDAPNTKVTPGSPAFGQVTLTEIAPNQVDVVVKLFNPQIGFVNTGNTNKSPFTFNLTGDYDVTVYNPLAGQQFADGGFGSFQNNNFGLYTNKIDCCGGATGGGSYDPTDLHFVVTNLSGTLTFAGVGATFDANGRLLTQGTGPRFLSTVETTVNKVNKNGKITGSQQYPGGFWFAADVVTNTGDTFDVAARDAFTQTSTAAVPEPATWALMIMGFGTAGAMLRRRRAVLA